MHCITIQFRIYLPYRLEDCSIVSQIFPPRSPAHSLQNWMECGNWKYRVRQNKKNRFFLYTTWIHASLIATCNLDTLSTVVLGGKLVVLIIGMAESFWSFIITFFPLNCDHVLHLHITRQMIHWKPCLFFQEKPKQ